MIPLTVHFATLILLARAQRRISRSLIAFSNDEGESWYGLKELPYELSGDRHKAEYDPVSDKVLVSFRDDTRKTKRHRQAYRREQRLVCLGRDL